jgi:riboflavin synthase
MFTGVVTAVGRISRVAREQATARREAGLALEIRAPYRGLKRGESIAVNGACLTVERVVRGGFRVRTVATTLGRTLFGDYQRGRRVNLERAVRAADRLGGHLVQGHVDGVAQVVRVATVGDARLVDLTVPADVLAVSIPLGAVTVDGVSLTVNAIGNDGSLQVSLIPYTLAHTTLGGLEPGDRVHVEGDVIGKYVRRLCRSET